MCFFHCTSTVLQLLQCVVFFCYLLLSVVVVYCRYVDVALSHIWHQPVSKGFWQMSSPCKWRRSCKWGQSSLTRIGPPIHLADTMSDIWPRYEHQRWSTDQWRALITIDIILLFKKQWVWYANDISSLDLIMLHHNICDKKALDSLISS